MENTQVKNYILDLENYLKLKGAETRPLNEIFKKGVIIHDGGTVDLFLDNCEYIPGQEIYLESATSNVTFKLDDYTIETELTGNLKVEFTENRPPTLVERVTALEQGGGVSEWVEVTLLSGTGNVYYRVNGGKVEFKGTIEVNGSTNLFTMPAELLPSGKYTRVYKVATTGTADGNMNFNPNTGNFFCFFATGKITFDIISYYL